MSGSPQRLAAFTAMLFVALTVPAAAEVDLVAVDVPNDSVWVGQKASFFVKLRGKGPFVGAASFSLPQIPRTVIMKVGNPVVSSEQLGDDTWFVQSHEFALFSQADGTVKVPAFSVRFSNRDGFTGPAHDHDELVPAIEFQVERPPGSEPATFLVTTDSLKVEQTWDPEPGAAYQGGVFHRTITQQAEQITGMALAPPPETVPDGVRVHFDDPTISDNTERGAFTGSRTDRITYELRQPGTVTLPAIEYVWWNPKSQKFGSTTLPAATFEVAAVEVQSEAQQAELYRNAWLWWLVVAGVACGLCYLQRERLAKLVSLAREKLNPPEQRIARKLLDACRRNDVQAAEATWGQWQAFDSTNITPRLSAAATDMQRVLYGIGGSEKWDGTELAAAFQEARSARSTHHSANAALPELNPTR